MIVVLGNENIVGNTVEAVDLRGGMAAVLLGIKAKGKTVIENKEIIERGYENILEKFIKIGVYQKLNLSRKIHQSNRFLRVNLFIRKLQTN